MSNLHGIGDLERNSNSSTNNSRGSFGMGGYDSNGKYNPWLKQQSGQQQQQQVGYSQLDGQGQQSSGGLLGGINLTWKCFAAINLILVWVVFLIAKALAQFTENSYNCVLFQAGAQYQPSITFNYEFHRYLFPVYLHGGFAHIISNSFGLFFYAFNLEQQYGIKKFMLFYFLCGIGGNLFSGFNTPDNMSVGASSSLFGLFPLMILFLMENQNINQRQKNFYVIYILLMILANFFGSSPKSKSAAVDGDSANESQNYNVDSAAHFGGLLTGIFLSVIYSQHPHPKLKYLKIASYVILIGGLTSLFVYNQLDDSINRPQGMDKFCAWK